MRTVLWWVVGGLAAVVSGCAGPQASGPVSGLSESAEMTAEPGVAQGWTYRDPRLDPRDYRAVLIDPAHVYEGAGSDFSDLSESEIRAIAQMLPDETRTALEGHVPIATKAAPDVIRLRFTLIRVEETVPYLATATRIIPIGAVMNLGRAAAGEGGSLTGSLTILVEAFNSATGKLLVASQRHVSPGAFDLQATLGTKQAAEAVAKQVAAGMLERLQKAMGNR